MYKHKNIVFYLYNTSMYNYTVRGLIPYLDKYYKASVIHVSNLSREFGDHAIDSRFLSECRDVSTLSPSEIERFLIKLKTDCVVFFTYQGFFDYVLFTICRKLGIPTLYHDHGIVYGKTTPDVVFKRFSKRNRFRVYRYFKLLSSLVIYSKWQSLGCLYELAQLLGFNNFRCLRFNRALHFSEYNRQEYSNILGIPGDDSCVAGFPFWLDQQDKVSQLNTEKNDSILYIHQPFRHTGQAAISLEEELIFFTNLREIVNEHGYRLCIRLHPIAEASEYTSLLHKGICINRDDALSLQCAKASAVIGHWSTALLNAAILNIPLITMPYPHLRQEDCRFYKLFANISTWCNNMTDLANVIGQIEILMRYDSCPSRFKHMLGHENTFAYNATIFSKQINACIASL